MVTQTIFIYGSLKRGRANHMHLTGARFVGCTHTAAIYTLADLGPYPALLAEGTTAVHGELYEVDAPLLARLDDFEGHPHLYHRRAVQLHDATPAQAYFLTDPTRHTIALLPSGHW